ncbi:hypothetical protein JCM31826_01360 [Thermaurantimonas aggregans]|uniref:DUF6046 domain-containing protein n=1 Tax=Thermaurantimonas aggregans TaxID=2173829 RepID=A0A401XI55_9FLAO|nr:DUF6046 domain-containing protein [Thermaurantimonas aggregans]GCD76654.1 hypothetical protein JCM31826_01360 [Thermaurantimonas aggregans]
MKPSKAIGIALPPYLPTQKITVQLTEATIQNTELNALAEFRYPFKLKFENELDGFLLPLEPVITISGANKIVRRYIQSGKKGSVKEFFCTDDYRITVAGLLCSDENASAEQYAKRLKNYLESNESLQVQCPLLNEVFDIFSIVIDSYEFPFTPGEEYQQFTFTAYSDESLELFIEN